MTRRSNSKRRSRKYGNNPVIFAAICKDYGIPEPETEYRFHPTRRWRFDYAWIEKKIALEVEGGVWTGGRHTRSKGFINDIEKYNQATALGWRLFRCTPDELCTGEMVRFLKTVMEAVDA